MVEKSQSEKSSQESSSKNDSVIALPGGSNFRSKSVSPLTLVVAELQRISPAAMGQLSAPMLDLLNLTDISESLTSGSAAAGEACKLLTTLGKESKGEPDLPPVLRTMGPTLDWLFGKGFTGAIRREGRKKN